MIMLALRHRDYAAALARRLWTNRLAPHRTWGADEPRRTWRLASPLRATAFARRARESCASWPSLDGMRHLGRLAVIAALLASAACVSSRYGSQSVSIAQLLAHPGEFHGKAVVVLAYAKIEFEGDRLCAVPGAPMQSCVSLSFDDGPYETEQDMDRYLAAQERWRAFDGKRVLVRGTFSRGPSGHFGLFPGEISHIAGVELAS